MSMPVAAAPGYIDAYTRQFSLSPADTALVIVDLQYANGVALVSDATGACSDEMQRATEKTFRHLCGRVLDTADGLAEMRGTP